MNIYEQKRRWKWSLFAAAVLIVMASLWYTNILVQKIATDERSRMQIWADAIQKKAHFVTYTENFFQKIKIEEQKKVHQLAMATKFMVASNPGNDLTFYSEIINDNTTVPVILTDAHGNINAARNVDFRLDTVKVLSGKLLEQFQKYPPITLVTYGMRYNFYYTDSKLFSELRVVLNDLIHNFFSEIVENSASVPVIITDSSKKRVVQFGNLDSMQMKDGTFVEHTLSEMEFENAPIQVKLEDKGINYVYYKSSVLLTQLKYYPLFQLGIIGIFLLISYMLFSTARRSEQNRVWVGMAKETAHQLGTPISSMMAWIELMKMRDQDKETVTELEKDVKRLSTIAERFSKIGSAPALKEENIVQVVYDTIEYLKPRTSRKVNFSVNLPQSDEIWVPVNPGLFEWVVENICKNSIDAMSGDGFISIDILEEGNFVHIDVTDTGKGLTRSKFKTIFEPGYTSKKRGWGLGLTLSKRIIEEYHLGKIFVKSSVISEGTTLRISLKQASGRSA